VILKTDREALHEEILQNHNWGII